MEKGKLEERLRMLTVVWQSIGKTIDDLESQKELMKESMKWVLEKLGVDRYEDSKGNLWVLKKGEQHEESSFVMYVPIESRLKQQPKLQINTKQSKAQKRAQKNYENRLPIDNPIIRCRDRFARHWEENKERQYRREIEELGNIR